MLWAPPLGVWQVALRRAAPGPLQMSHSWPLGSSVSAAEGRLGEGGLLQPQSFFRRLYISLLLFSPAHVRLLVRNFFRSSLKSS